MEQHARENARLCYRKLDVRICFSPIENKEGYNDEQFALIQNVNGGGSSNLNVGSLLAWGQVTEIREYFS
ncbi:hypothetical protein [Dysgonomonas mossii]|uniref:hypothetical protein n=1 Tax=Dysgonomonas mossii TaxID=163665 RepID=UPI003991E2B0